MFVFINLCLRDFIRFLLDNSETEIPTELKLEATQYCRLVILLLMYDTLLLPSGQHAKVHNGCTSLVVWEFSPVLEEVLKLK